MALKFALNNSLSAITSLPASISGGGMTLLSTQTASSSSTISFTSGIDSTYDSYVFKFYDIHPATNNAELSFNMSIDGGSNYNVTKTTSSFRAYHPEDNSTTSLAYVTDFDLAQSTAFQPLALNQGIGNDNCAVGTMVLYAPSNTTFVKHFIFTGNNSHTEDTPATVQGFFAGYGNTTSSVNAIQFKMSSGNIDSGVIKLYGIS